MASSSALFVGGPAPMLSVPPKQTAEVDWAAPLKQHIANSGMADPESFRDECAQLNRLRIDMYGATMANSVNSKDLLYRYYGQLELLDLRFPVDEANVKITFTWNDAFTHAPTSQFSLAFEKASILFNIGSVISHSAVACDRRVDEQLKMSYHSFKSAAGLFTYINQNFLHAPSFDLQTESIESLTKLMLAQAQEVFLERLINGYVSEQAAAPSEGPASDKPSSSSSSSKPAMLAKLATEAANLYSSLAESIKSLDYFSYLDKAWPQLIQTKAHYMKAIAQYFQSIVDNLEARYGSAVGRLQSAQKSVAAAAKSADNISPDSSSKVVPVEAGQTMRRLLEALKSAVQERLTEYTRDNDFIYHDMVPGPDALAAIPPLVGANPTPVSELYKGRDVQEIIGTDIFEKFVPLSITEAVSRYDEEKAKLIRSEAEHVNTQASKIRITLDRLKLPESLDLLIGDLSHKTIIPQDFIRWCGEISEKAPVQERLAKLTADKEEIDNDIAKGAKLLDREETLCEMMRKKYGDLWTQEGSRELNTSFRLDINNYQKALREAAESDKQLRRIFDKYPADFDAMHEAGRLGEAEVLFQQAMLEADARRGGQASPGFAPPEADLLDADLDDARPSIDGQIEEIRAKLAQLEELGDTRIGVLEKLRDRVRKDDISQALMRLARSAPARDEDALFRKHLDKFAPYRAHIADLTVKQVGVLQQLVRQYEVLLLDERVKQRQRAHEGLLRRSEETVTRYRAVYKAFADLNKGMDRAAEFYAAMKASVDELVFGIQRFVGTRREEGSQLLTHIESLRVPQKATRMT